MAYFPTPFDFYALMAYLGVQAQNGTSPLYYQFSCTATPTDAASYAANVTWLDPRPQPTWAYLTTGAGWQSYNNYMQASYGTPLGTSESAIAQVLAKFPARVATVVTRALNTAFQISSTRDAYAHYSCTIASTLNITTGQTGSVSLQMSPDQINWNEIARAVNGNTGTLSAGLNLTQTVCPPLTGLISAGSYVKLVTSGTAAVTYVTGQETLL